MKNRSRLQLEALEDRTTPSSFDTLPAFRGLDTAAARLYPTDPHRPLVVAPVFALNYGSGSETLPAQRGLQTALARLVPPNPIHVSPVFFGLTNGNGGGPVT